MPLKPGKTKAIIKRNAIEMIHSYERKGKIGSSKPKNKKKAIKQAFAAAYAKARKSRGY